MRNIFKKYGFIVSAVVLAVGETIGVIVSALTRGLKSVAKGVGDGVKTLGSKSASFPTAGSVISFLGQKEWLLIMLVAIFVVERSRTLISVQPKSNRPFTIS